MFTICSFDNLMVCQLVRIYNIFCPSPNDVEIYKLYFISEFKLYQNVDPIAVRRNTVNSSFLTVLSVLFYSVIFIKQ